MRSKRKFTRKSGLRDAKLIVIATEGEQTEKAYFNGIAFSTSYRNSAVHIEVLDRLDGNSDPKNCLLLLNKFKSEYHLNQNDELWLVCDVDRWGDKKLSEVNQLCKQKGYKLAISNPCFELWLLIHHVKVSDSLQEFETLTCAQITERLRAALGAYNKANLNIDNFIDNVSMAIVEARVLDNPAEEWPNSVGSKVFLLIESMITK